MILLADSGSTKTSWCLVTDAHSQPPATHRFSTLGYNPDFYTPAEMQRSIGESVVTQLGAHAAKVSEIHFYGAGCSRAANVEMVQTALATHFTTAHIAVEHDLLAAARALCFHEAGIACILGTGSNSCHYDGKHVVDNVASIGFTIGDEGSGGYMGKQLLRAYFYRDLPLELLEAFNEQYGLSESEILTNIYQKPMPNRFVAQFSQFCNTHREHPFMHALIRGSFAEFIDRQVLKYPTADANGRALPISFLGSIAYVFQADIRELLAERGLPVGTFIRNPIDNLIRFHLEA